MSTIDMATLIASMTVGTKDISLATQLVEETQAFIAGSFLTNPDTANDIDVVIGETQYWQYEEHFAAFRQYDKLDGDQYRQVHEIAWISYVGRVNLLVVKDIFLECYAQAAETMERTPSLYQSRKARIALHQTLKNMVRNKYGHDLITIVE